MQMLGLQDELITLFLWGKKKKKKTLIEKLANKVWLLRHACI